MPIPRISRVLLCLVVLLVASPLQPAFAHEPACAEEHERDLPLATSTTEAHGQAPLDLPAYRERVEAYYYSGQYIEEIAGVVKDARAYLAQRLEEGVDKPAIVLDIDETSLSNWTQMVGMQFGYERGVWHEWVETASAYAIGPTLDLALWAHDHDVAVFFITGRGENERAATARNLEAVGFRWTALYLEDETKCCQGDSCDFAATCKSFYRKKIHDEGYRILINMGDQRSDLLGGWSERSYKLPNPFYLVR